jgi:DNA repair exonuclease SbcCD nuclease subunit
MAKKKKIAPESEEEDDVPTGKVDEDGDEILDLYDEKDNLDDDLDYDISNIDDEMLADETEDEEFGYEISEVEALMRKVKCAPCPGSSSKAECKVRDDFGCPPDKANK